MIDQERAAVKKDKKRQLKAGPNQQVLGCTEEEDHMGVDGIYCPPESRNSARPLPD